MAEDLDIQHNFRAISTWEQAREALDATFQRIFDLLKSNPTLHALVDAREGEPPHKAGDFITDYRDGNVRLKMSDGKNMLEITVSALGGVISDTQHGNQGRAVNGSPMHTNATTGEPGFMSTTDKTKLDGLTNATPSNATPASVGVGSGAAAGSSTDYSRGDHVHQIAVAAPATIGTVNAAGSANSVSRSDHVHAHGNQAGGSLHAVATTGAHGFMSSTDKALLDLFDGYTPSGAMPTPALGHFVLWYDTGAAQLKIVATGGGGTKSVLLT